MNVATASGPLAVRVLGPLRAFLGDREVDLGPPLQRALFAVLALRAGRTVSPEELIDAIWGENLPGNPAGGVHTYVARLRSRLEPARSRRSPSQVLVSKDLGYLLHIPGGGLDVTDFEAHVDAGIRARKAGEPAAAEAAFDRALRLFTGQVLAGVPGPFAESHRLRLTERRLLVVEDRLEAVLAQSRAEETVADLRALTREDPLRERPWSLLMLALYRAGRQGEALEAFDRARAAAVEELGLDPGPALRELRQQIIEADPALDLPRPPIAVPFATGASDLPRDVNDFTGRAAEAAVLAGGAEAGPPGSPGGVWVIDGMAGVGKTAFAVHVAHRLAARFPDGQIYLDLHAHTPGRALLSPAAALDRLLRAAGVEGPEIPADQDEREALWRSRTSGRRILLLLDNAASAAQVRPLLPGFEGSLVLITSRHRLGGLEAAASLSLDVLPQSEAVALLASVVGDARPADEPRAAAAVVELCGLLPLAVRIAGARLRHRPAWSTASFQERLADQNRRLAELRVEDRAVAVAFASSHRALEAGTRRVFHLLGVLAGPTFDLLAVAAACGLSVQEAEAALDALLDMHLIEEPAQSVFRLHDLLAVFARQQCLLLESEAEREAAVRRWLDYYLHATNTAEDLVRSARTDRGPDAPPELALPAFADRRAALRWLDDERANVLAAVAAADEHGFADHAWRITRHLWGYFETRGLWNEWIQCGERALPNARKLGDQIAEARAHVALGVCLKELGRFDEAISHHTAASELFGLAGSRDGRAGSLLNLANVYRRMNAHALAISCLEQAQQIMAGSDSWYRRAGVLSALGDVRRAAGQPAASLKPYRRALKIAREHGHRALESRVMEGYVQALDELGRHEETVAACHQALEAGADAENRYGQALALDVLGRALAALGRGSESMGHWQRALILYDELAAQEAGNLRVRMAAMTEIRTRQG